MHRAHAPALGAQACWPHGFCGQAQCRWEAAPLGCWSNTDCFLLFPQVDGILKTVLRDEIIAWHKKTQEDTSSPLSAAGQPENMDSQQLVSLVQKAVTAIVTRLHSLAQFEGGESKVNTLVAAANSLDNLCRMDPAWHPWL